MKEMLQRKVTAIGGRDGNVESTTSGITYDLRKPVEMGGTSNPGTDPEELFAAGYASCLASSIEYLLSANGIAYDEVRVEATNHLMMVPNKGFQFVVDMKTTIKGVSKDIEKEYTAKGEAFCPFSRAIKGNVIINHI